MTETVTETVTETITKPNLTEGDCDKAAKSQKSCHQFEHSVQDVENPICDSIAVETTQIPANDEICPPENVTVEPPKTDLAITDSDLAKLGEEVCN